MNLRRWMVNFSITDGERAFTIAFMPFVWEFGYGPYSSVFKGVRVALGPLHFAVMEIEL